MEIRINEPMKMHTSFRAVDRLPGMRSQKRQRSWGPGLPLPKGRTALVHRGKREQPSGQRPGYPGLIVSTSRFDRLETEGEILRAGSGVLLSRAASLALKCGLTGFEFAAGSRGPLEEPVS